MGRDEKSLKSTALDNTEKFSLCVNLKSLLMRFQNKLVKIFKKKQRKKYLYFYLGSAANCD